MFSLADAGTAEFIKTLPEEYLHGKLTFQTVKDIFSVALNMVNFSSLKGLAFPQAAHQKYLEEERDVTQRLAAMKEAVKKGKG